MSTAKGQNIAGSKNSLREMVNSRKLSGEQLTKNTSQYTFKVGNKIKYLKLF